MRARRRHQRFVRRLETEFSDSNKTYRGISSDLSCSGLFIRTSHAFAPQTIIDITIHMPDGIASKLKGRVKRAIKTPAISMKNGMGIELLDKDDHYMLFMSGFTPDCEEDVQQPATQDSPQEQQTSEQPQQLEYLLIVCPACNVKNKVRKERLAFNPKCGKCNALLPVA